MEKLNYNRKIIVFSYYTKAGKELPRIRVLEGYVYDEVSEDREPGFKWQPIEHGNNFSLHKPCLEYKNFEKVKNNIIWFEDNEPYEVLAEKAKEEFKRRWAEKYNVHDYFTRLKVLESL